MEIQIYKPPLKNPEPAECECPICQETTQAPKTTSCQHTFCALCLDKWLMNNHTCPMCRTQIRDPTDVERLGFNLTFNHPIREITAVARYYNMLRGMSGLGGLTFSN